MTADLEQGPTAGEALRLNHRRTVEAAMIMVSHAVATDTSGSK